ncbi:MAG: papain-like cysteine protease family protein [Endozoicomonas sp.]|uniref:papain-like cysteine protease family protein n=1 Tax=Endozoicomonas sp. TaxID=1892382 RepID=UPI003D9BCA14
MNSSLFASNNHKNCLKPDFFSLRSAKSDRLLAIGTKGYIQLVENEGLTLIPLPKNKQWTCGQLAGLLRDCGPVYVRRGWVKNGKVSGGHAVVMVGARESDNRVVIHDPGSRGHDWECSIDEFNGFIKWDSTKSKYTMMCKLPKVMTRPRSNAIV